MGQVLNMNIQGIQELLISIGGLALLAQFALLTGWILMIFFAGFWLGRRK